ncbi:TPA: glycosyltransferase family 2 protein [Raoultella ornithinolytica]|nr:glycosyltransferase family 2 protein [Raoultella ornithinolytica]
MNISVVIPYFNNSNEFSKCINSIVNQSIKPYEIIIVDDNSIDSQQLFNILKKYENKNKIRYFRNDENRNASYSRNFGIKNAVGEFIALIDADDYWEQDHIESGISKLIECNASFTYSNITYLKNGVLKKSRVDDINNLSNPADLVLLSPPQTSSFIFKKDLYMSVQFDESLRRHQDYQFLVDVILSDEKVIYNNKYTSVYVVPGVNLARKLDFDSIFSFWQRYGHLFTSNLLKRYLIRMLCLNMRTKNEHNIEYYMRKYSILNCVSNSSFYTLYQCIGDSNFLSKRILFLYFKLKYDFLAR